ncbi:MAG TPA: hypothetical protein VD931_21225 [Baekduia sp.]|nr:hypothetical protein [Baekduia sp.]
MPTLRASLIALALVLAAPSAAQACSIVAPEPREQLSVADAAGVVTVLERRDTPPGPDGTTSSGDPTTLRARVERVVKGPLAREIEIRTVRDGATCGLEADPGDRFAVFLDRDGDTYTAYLGDRTTEGRLAAAARPWRRSRRAGPLRLLVAGGLGTARLLGLDARGRVRAVGAGRGIARAVVLCPGARRAVELVTEDGPTRLEVRDLPSLRVVRRLWLARAHANGFRCKDPLGRRVVAGRPRSGARLTASGRTALLPRGARVRLPARARAVALVPRQAR